MKQRRAFDHQVGFVELDRRCAAVGQQLKAVDDVDDGLVTGVTRQILHPAGDDECARVRRVLFRALEHPDVPPGLGQERRCV